MSRLTTSAAATVKDWDLFLLTRATSGPFPGKGEQSWVGAGVKHEQAVCVGTVLCTLELSDAIQLG